MGADKNFLLFILFFIVMTILQYSCQGQNSQQDYLDAHNAARAQVGVGPMTWDEKVAAFARNYANQRAGDCNLDPSTNRPYGENLAKGTGSFSGRDAVETWVKEKSDYDYFRKSCVGGGGGALCIDDLRIKKEDYTISPYCASCDRIGKNYNR